LKKIRAMSAGEVWTRIRYDAYCRLERNRHARGALAHGNRFQDALAPAIAGAADWRTALLAARRQRGARFFAGAEQLDATRSLLLERYPREVELARAQAEKASRHEFSFFGGTYRYGDRVDWHADPVTGAQWPQRYHRDVPVHGGNVGFGDVKHVWELGRHQFLIDLAKGWVLERNPGYAAAMRALVFDWRAANPVGTGVGWSCALEPAFRMLSWLWGYYLTRDDPAFDDASHVQWLEGFHEHGWFLHRHLEYYASPYNHLVGEACALYALGVLFPEFREAPEWRDRGRSVLVRVLPGQFYADGGTVEQSTFYHHATTGFYLLAALLGRVNGEEFPSAVWSAIERGVDFSAAMRQPDGTTPRIGGADDGKPIRLEELPLWDFRPYQAVGAVVFDRGDFKEAAGRFYEDAVWLLGPDGAASFDRLPAAPPARRSRAIEASGYVLLRSGWAADADYVSFDCGDQAAGVRRDAIPSAAHGHADCLSIVLWQRGRPVLVDAGFHCYNGPKPWQDHFRETAAHSTVRVDGRDQALHINKMAWAYTYAATLEGHRLEEPSPWAIASHDGYRLLPGGPVRHRRGVWLRERGYVVVCDVIDGTGSHDVEVIYQFAPGRLAAGPATATFDDRTTLHWFATAGISAAVHEGGETPESGWIAPSLGVKTPAPRLVLSARLALPATIVSVIADSGRAAAVTRPAGDRGPIVVAGEGWTDWLIVPGVAEDGRFQTDALAAAWTAMAGGEREDGRLGGSFQGGARDRS
jgi:hypothetical protein